MASGRSVLTVLRLSWDPLVPWVLENLTEQEARTQLAPLVYPDISKMLTLRPSDIESEATPAPTYGVVAYPIGGTTTTTSSFHPILSTLMCQPVYGDYRLHPMIRRGESEYRFVSMEPWFVHAIVAPVWLAYMCSISPLGGCTPNVLETKKREIAYDSVLTIPYSSLPSSSSSSSSASTPPPLSLVDDSKLSAGEEEEKDKITHGAIPPIIDVEVIRKCTTDESLSIPTPTTTTTTATATDSTTKKKEKKKKKKKKKKGHRDTTTEEKKCVQCKEGTHKERLCPLLEACKGGTSITLHHIPSLLHPLLVCHVPGDASPLTLRAMTSESWSNECGKERALLFQLATDFCTLYFVGPPTKNRSLPINDLVRLLRRTPPPHVDEAARGDVYIVQTVQVWTSDIPTTWMHAVDFPTPLFHSLQHLQTRIQRQREGKTS